ncbi:Mon1 protein [Martiniozyma asiatica (nom. inval.)]|nr:Mon1 protein [Martiniozyma asiatica]
MHQLLILSSAGKPIYSLNGELNEIAAMSAIVQTIQAFYEFSPSNQQLQSFTTDDNNNGNGGNTRTLFVFSNKSPILLLAVSSDPMSTTQELSLQLDILYSFLLATLSKPFIDKTFSRRANFDLRQLLSQTDVDALDSLCNGLVNRTNPFQTFGGLSCMKMKSSIRRNLERQLSKHQTENLLYALIVGPNGSLIDIMRPKRHSLHTSDLSILFDMVYNTNTFKSPNGKLTTSETFWLPLCLPKFNSSGHLYTLIQFHQINDPRLCELHGVEYIPNEDSDKSKIAIMILTPYKDAFTEMKKVASGIAKLILFNKSFWNEIYKGLLGSNILTVESILPPMGTLNGSNVTTKSIRSFFLSSPTPTSSPLHTPTPTDADINTATVATAAISATVSNDDQSIRPITSLMSNLDIPLHFVIKNRKLTQFIYPHTNNNFLPIYASIRNQLQSGIKLIHFHGMTVIGVILTNYEIYVIGKGAQTMSQMMTFVRRLLKYSRKEEQRLFISTGCIF